MVYTFIFIYFSRVQTSQVKIYGCFQFKHQIVLFKMWQSDYSKARGFDWWARAFWWSLLHSSSSPDRGTACALWWLIPMCDHRVPTEQLEIHGVQGNYLHPSWHYDKWKLFYRTKHMFKDRCLQRYVCWLSGEKCPFCASPFSSPILFSSSSSL